MNLIYNRMTDTFRPESQSLQYNIKIEFNVKFKNTNVISIDFMKSITIEKYKLN